MALLQLEHPPILESLHVYLNGIEQYEGTDWRLFKSSDGLTFYVQTLSGMEVQTNDLLEAKYSWAVDLLPEASSNPYGPGSPASGPAAGTQFDEPSEWPYFCNGGNRYWTPEGYVPPGYATLTSGPNNTLQQPRLDVDQSSALTCSGFGTGTAVWRWHRVSGDGLAGNFGTVRVFFLQPNGCVVAYIVYDALNYSSPGFSVDGTVTAGGVVSGPLNNGDTGPPAGSIFIRAIRNYHAQASWFVTHDVGYNPGIP